MTNEYTVTGSKGDIYKVKIGENTWECTCKAFTYSKETPPICKHIKKVIEDKKP